jgi:hypothetical protein
MTIAFVNPSDCATAKELQFALGWRLLERTPPGGMDTATLS